MRPHFDEQIQISRRSAHGSGIAFARNSHPAARSYASGNAYVNRFGAAHAAFAAAGLAGGAKLSGAATAAAGNVEAHFSGGLLNGASAIAGWTGLRRADRSRTVAGFAGVHAGDLQFFYTAAHRIPEINFQFVFERAARLGFFFQACAAAAAKKLAKEIAETCAAPSTSAAAATAEIEPVEIEIDVAVAAARSALAIIAGGNIFTVKTILIVHLTFFAVGQNVVGFLQLLEFFFGSFVARIEIGVVFACEFAESGANILRGGFARDTEKLVIVGFGGGRHVLGS